MKTFSKTFAAMVLALGLCLGLAGCPDPYGDVAKAGSGIGESITQAMQTTSQLAAQGTITPAEALNVLGYLEFANKGDGAFLSCVATAHKNGNKPGTYTACAVAFNSTLNTPAQLALIHVANSGAATTISTIVTGFSTAVTAIETALGGA